MALYGDHVSSCRISVGCEPSSCIDKWRGSSGEGYGWQLVDYRSGAHTSQLERRIIRAHAVCDRTECRDGVEKWLAFFFCFFFCICCNFLYPHHSFDLTVGFNSTTSCNFSGFGVKQYHSCRKGRNCVQPRAVYTARPVGALWTPHSLLAAEPNGRNWSSHSLKGGSAKNWQLLAGSSFH